MMTEIFIRKQKIQPGKLGRLREWMDELVDAAETDTDGVRHIWADEGLYSISLFIEHTEEAAYLVWYLEAESMHQLIEARAVSTHPLHDVEDEMMEDVLEDPMETGEFEPLLHGVSPDRPASFDLQEYSSTDVRGS